MKKITANTKTIRTTPKKNGHLVIIGGHEDKAGTQEILKLVAEKVGKGKLLIITAASSIPEEMYRTYLPVFQKLGVRSLAHIDIRQTADCHDPKTIAEFDGATGAFFTGGDQLKITTKLGGTPIAQRLRDIHNNGGVIAGTSAGASAIGEVMIIGGENTESHKVGNSKMAPGLRFIKNLIVDQHFAQRGRIGRLLGAVAMNPGLLGIGIDENTAIHASRGKFQVYGEGAVYVVDGSEVRHTNVSEGKADQTMSMFDSVIHVLAPGDGFNIDTRRPVP